MYSWSAKMSLYPSASLYQSSRMSCCSWDKTDFRFTGNPRTCPVANRFFLFRSPTSSTSSSALLRVNSACSATEGSDYTWGVWLQCAYLCRRESWSQGSIKGLKWAPFAALGGEDTSGLTPVVRCVWHERQVWAGPNIPSSNPQREIAAVRPPRIVMPEACLRHDAAPRHGDWVRWALRSEALRISPG